MINVRGAVFVAIFRTRTSHQYLIIKMKTGKGQTEQRLFDWKIRAVYKRACDSSIAAMCVLFRNHGRDRMIVGFTTTCAISAYHH